MTTLSLPPLLRGQASRAPRADAIAAAREGCDGGTFLHDVTAHVEAALVLAPDVPLARAAQVGPLAAVALRDAIGAAGEAEVPVHIEWGDVLRVDGAQAGRVRVITPTTDGTAVPDWLVLHVSLRRELGEPLIRADPVVLLESFSRHLVHRLATWEEDGPAALHAELQGAAWERHAGDETFLGRDEHLGRLRRDGRVTVIDPLTDLLEAP